MGLFGFLGKLIFGRLIPLIVLILAIFVGWLNTSPNPWGKFFATVIPAAKGIWPPTVVGHGKMSGTPPVPADMLPEPRPEDEFFVELPGGDQMPQTGLGMCCRPSAYDDVLVERSVLWYLLMGGRHIDGAYLYLNHEAIGKGIQEAIRRGIPREEIFVTTKIWVTSFGYNTTMESVPKYVEELGLDYIDMILMHAPTIPGVRFNWMSSECSAEGLSKKECRQETFRALSDLRSKGVVRNVGISNFPTKLIQELQQVENAAPIANNQIQYNPWLTDDWLETVAYCQEQGIAITGYNSLGGSFQHHEAHTIEVLTQLSNHYNVSVAQIMLRWALQKGTIVIPGTGNPKHMRENLAIYTFSLSQEDVAAIDALRTDEEMKKFIVMDTKTYDA